MTYCDRTEPKPRAAVARWEPAANRLADTITDTMERFRVRFVAEAIAQCRAKLIHEDPVVWASDILAAGRNSPELKNWCEELEGRLF